MKEITMKIRCLASLFVVLVVGGCTQSHQTIYTAHEIIASELTPNWRDVFYQYYLNDQNEKILHGSYCAKTYYQSENELKPTQWEQVTGTYLHGKREGTWFSNYAGIFVTQWHFDADTPKQRIVTDILGNELSNCTIAIKDNEYIFDGSYLDFWVKPLGLQYAYSEYKDGLKTKETFSPPHIYDITSATEAFQAKASSWPSNYLKPSLNEFTSTVEDIDSLKSEFYKSLNVNMIKKD